jgi:hypothetical protein
LSGIRASGHALWTDPVQVIWGYRELIDDPRHLDDLFEFEDRALGVFIEHLLAAETAHGIVHGPHTPSSS